MHASIQEIDPVGPTEPPTANSQHDEKNEWQFLL